MSLYQKTYPGGKDDVFSITWRPYYLNYHGSSLQSVDKSQVADIKLGGMDPAARAALARRMEQIGRSVGLDFKWGGKVGDTHDAYRLVYLSRSKPDVQDLLVEKLFHAYHEREQDISSPGVLREIAIAAGLEETEVDELLNSAMASEAVNAEADVYRSRVEGLGVPSYVIQGVHKLHGALDPHDFMEVFIKVKEAEAAK